MIPAEKLEQIVTRAEALEAQLADPGKLGSEEFASVSKEYAELSPIVAKIQALRAARQEAGDLEALLADPDTDPDMRELAEAEIADVKARVSDLEHEIQILLLPKDIADEKNAILEVRAGTGGEEAALFAADLFRMYHRYADLQGWRFETMEINESAVGGYKEAVAKISGKGVFARLKFESGVHRVQRVPETEAGGRIHTSAATVAVLPEAEEVDVHIEDKDLRIDVFRASGPGGQSVNTTDSAVRITHIPTGIVVQQQDEKSQHKNRAKALTILRSRLLQEERERQMAARAESRKTQVGSGDRSERVRTYNFPQNRVTDHRINLTLHKLEQIMSGEALDEVIDELIAADQAEQIAALEAV